MTKDRIDKLNAIGFAWRGSQGKRGPGTTWEAIFERLKLFKEEHGHAMVPDKWKEDQTLSSWVKTQRQEKKRLDEGSKSTLNQVRLKALEDVGFSWSPFDERWDSHF